MIKFSSSTSRQSTRNSNNFGCIHYARSSSTSTQNGSYQKAAINVNSQNLGKPYILNVEISDPQLTCQVKINGEVAQQLNSTNSHFNLSPYLLLGKNIVEILAPYSSNLSFIGVELLGPDTRVVQRTSGIGALSHTLIVIVR